ncbi:MAG: hypothetical protein Q7S61_04745 [bacterium]|nr:hypothetical protein [bacterium]
MIQNISDTSSQTPVGDQSQLFSFKPLHLIIGIIILVVLSSLGTYFVLKSNVKQPATFQPSPTQPQTIPTDTLNEMQNWKTYTNDTMAFSLSYPTDGTYEERKPLSGSINEKALSVVVFTYPYKVNRGNPLSVSVFGSENDSKRYTGFKTGSKAAKVGNYDAFYLQQAVETYPIEYYWIKANGKLYEITIEHQNPNQPLDIINQILSTFKFLDEKETIVPTKTQIITIPKDWKSFTDTDSQSKITTTLSLPPGYSFKFSGSAWMIRNDSDAGEIWSFHPDYNSSYDGTSRRAWVQKIYPDYKIIQVEEIPLEGSSYLKISIETPTYDNGGIATGTTVVINHYVYVQNNIATMISPSSIKTSSSQTAISQNIAIIFSSLKVIK